MSNFEKNYLTMKRLFLFWVLLIASSVSAQSPDITRRIDALFASYHNEMPGAAVAVSLDGKVVYNKAFGLANLEYFVPNTTATIFESGSVSKQFVAASVLLLAKEGKLSLSDDVRKYVPELPVYDATITIDMLLSHTSGLKDWGALYSLTGWPRTSRVYTQELGYDIIFKQKSLNFTPGSEYSYSNSNYMMLVLITERVSSLTLAQFTHKHFFEPLGMVNTKWRDNYRAIVPGRATAYIMVNGEFLLNMPFEDLHGPGGLMTTTSDLLLWNTLHETYEIFGKNYASNRIEVRPLNDGSFCSYAAGLTIDSYNCYKEIAHSGSTGGYRAWLAWYPEKRLSVVLLSNYAQFSPVTVGRAIAAIFLGQDSSKVPGPSIEQAESKEYPVKASDYTGIYHSSEVGVTYTLRENQGKVEVFRKAGDSFVLNYNSSDNFTTTGNGTFSFIRGRKGKVTGFKVSVTRASDVPFVKID